ncbi:hypothetical protein DAKH74_054490 [Maudiozyma humilis]|uniref:Uncharacterized protein n=1 Tax=Maudiozyma humilis TaxID=51915 RepID=A0AAV5S5B0_MAUHU|nr:hypothetical protein DAKH74_054490 [Kazachstania humilis]
MKSEHVIGSKEFKKRVQRFKVSTPVQIVERPDKKPKLLSADNNETEKDKNDIIYEFNTVDVSEKKSRPSKPRQEEDKTINNIMQSLRKISSMARNLYGEDDDITNTTSEDDEFRAVDEIKDDRDFKTGATLTSDIRPVSTESGPPKLRADLNVKANASKKRGRRKFDDSDSDDSITEQEIGKLLPLDSKKLDEMKQRIDDIVDRNEAIIQKRRIKRRKKRQQEANKGGDKENEETSQSSAI